MPELTDAPAGVQLPYVESMPAYFFSANAAVTANLFNATRFRVAKTMTVTTMTVFVTVANGNIDLGIYQSDGTTLTKIASTGSTVAAGTNALQAVALTASVVLQPNTDYYLALSTDSATFACSRFGGVGALNAAQKLSVNKSVAFPLPTPVTLASTAGTSSTFWIMAS